MWAYLPLTKAHHTPHSDWRDRIHTFTSLLSRLIFNLFVLDWKIMELLSRAAIAHPNLKSSRLKQMCKCVEKKDSWEAVLPLIWIYLDAACGRSLSPQFVSWCLAFVPTTRFIATHCAPRAKVTQKCGQADLWKKRVQWLMQSEWQRLTGGNDPLLDSFDQLQKKVDACITAGDGVEQYK